MMSHLCDAIFVIFICIMDVRKNDICFPRAQLCFHYMTLLAARWLHLFSSIIIQIHAALYDHIEKVVQINKNPRPKSQNRLTLVSQLKRKQYFYTKKQQSSRPPHPEPISHSTKFGYLYVTQSVCPIGFDLASKKYNIS